MSLGLFQGVASLAYGHTGLGLGWFPQLLSAGLFKLSSLQRLPRQISNTQWGENRVAEGGMEGEIDGKQ